ncbi:MAG: transglutaminase family protein [Pseudomonadota bacterium]
MTIRVALSHRTRYHYDRRITVHPQVVRLRPAPHARTTIESYSMKVSPGDHFLNWHQDPFGNYLARLVFPEPVDHLEVAVEVIADLQALNPFDFFVEEYAFHVPFEYPAALRKELAPYLERVDEPGKRFASLVRDARAAYEASREAAEEDRRSTVDFLVDLNRELRERIGYTIREEPGVQTPEQTLQLATGSCRDSGWLLVALLRELGLAARFVSGYLIQLTWDEPDLDGAPGPAEDFTDLHAWAECYVPGAGWVGLDPTSGLAAGEGHIPLAATPSPQSAAPIAGSLEPCEVEFDVEMTITRLAERPRITAPIDDRAWARLDDVGHRVDEILRQDDVRLTMGGEPTFVADSDRDADEWNTAAVGPTKRQYADTLIRAMGKRFAPNGLLQHGQGKWYPGEPLPRWGYALYWRTDGEPLWTTPSLIAGEQGQAGPAEAGSFMRSLCQALEIETECGQPIYEDPGEFLLAEQRLPENVAPENNRLEDPMERARLARVFERGLGEPAAFVLPLQEAQAQAAPRVRRRQRSRNRWRSERWQTRRGHLFLLPGDSPAGFRLPLRSLAWIAEDQYPHVHPLDPFAPREALPPPRFQRRSAEPTAPQAPETAFADVGTQSAGAVIPGGPGTAVRTALTVEPREGVLHIFLPPVSSADAYVDLIAAVEDVAAALGLPVRLEGYPPPPDPRLQVLKVTPDPGVVELNVQPAASWPALREVTESAYTCARDCGLDPVRYSLDGRAIGSGGGAHLVMGAASPADSPFLRRPDLLASMVRFFQHHPSLAYFFTGLFVGPSSQAPRVDEARQDSLYELELALNGVPEPHLASGQDCPPWRVDRLFRHLLTDVTGNTHRAEICIDKLFSPDGPTGRLGLVELRAFEMAPHPRLALAQQLLVRALIAALWRSPFREPLRRLATDLHDRYLLPYHLWQDLGEVIDFINHRLQLPLEQDWFAALLESRFPCYGSVTYGGVTVELRAALEPWHVLGEEGAVGGTTRFVDSSVERLQVRVLGATGDRLAVTCNGYRLPLTPTETPGESIAGVRFRAWWPAACLHPHIPPHAPLVFDVVDLAEGRSIGGCTYHASHPGGRNYDTQPVNAREAEGRRLARFEPFGHAPAAMQVREPKRADEFPATLDLRLQS